MHYLVHFTYFHYFSTGISVNTSCICVIIGHYRAIYADLLNLFHILGHMHKTIHAYTN